MLAQHNSFSITKNASTESCNSVLQVQGLFLEELILHGCKEMTNYSVEVLVKHQPSLLKLDISGCTELTSRSVEAIARGLKSLTHLSLSQDWRITEKGSPMHVLVYLTKIVTQCDHFYI